MNKDYKQKYVKSVYDKIVIIMITIFMYDKYQGKNSHQETICSLVV